MSDDREVRKETDFWGNQKEVIYQDGEKVGEIHTEERGGFLGLGAETTKVEYDVDHNEISHTTKEDRGGFFGIGSEEVDVKRDTDGNELSTSRVEERGGVLGIGSHHVRAERDSNGDLVSESNHESRGGFLGFGGERVRVTRYERRNSSSNPPNSQQSSVNYNSAYQAEPRDTYSSQSPSSPTTTSSGLGWIFVFIAIGFIVWFTSQNSRTQRNNEVTILPPATVISKNACPFEGCQFGKWSARKTVLVYDSIGGKMKNSIRAGELVNAIYGEIMASPLKAIVTGTYKTDNEQGINVGSTIYVLHPIGEGAVAVWKNGKVMHGSLDLTFHYENSNASRALQWAWWVQVRLRDGAIGWLKNPQGQFAGMDRFG